MERKIKTIQVGNQTLTFETGKIAKQANGAVIVRTGDTVIFTSACALSDPNASKDFFPLRVDYQEKFFSAGKTVGGFFKREGRPTEKETLTARLIDRPLRPMFEEGYCEKCRSYLMYGRMMAFAAPSRSRSAARPPRWPYPIYR